jgi:cytochrome c-type biogenesis protein CcmE
MKKRRLGFAAGALIVFSSLGYVMYGGLSENLVHFLTPAELLAKGSKVYDKPMRLGGQVMPGSLHWDATALDLRFTLQDQDAKVEVRSLGKQPPQMFREGQGVIVEGKYTRAGVFESSSLMVKHSNEYRPPADGHPKPEEMYRSLIKEKGA